MRTSLKSAAAPAAAAAPDLRFRPAGPGAFQFSTGALEGMLRPDGRSNGLRPLVHSATGTPVAAGMGLLGVYRVFSDGRRYGDGQWYVPSDATLLPDGAVDVRWPAAADRPYELETVYRWSGPAALDLEVEVRATADLRGYEAFLASYFTPPFTGAAALARTHGLLAADRDSGVWQMFPRDAAAAALIRDGRWKLPPSPVDWVIRPEYELPAAIRRHLATGLTIAILAQREGCFALSAPNEGEGHYSLYLSLFGRDFKKGESARTRLRLHVLPGCAEEEIRALYRAFAQAR